ncbi:MAG: site-2 protease family protein [Candidatus Methanofastidiosia archaeon]
MIYRYTCSRCSYTSFSNRRRPSPDCPRCGALLNEEETDEKEETFVEIENASKGFLFIERISMGEGVIIVDMGNSEPNYEQVKNVFEPLSYDAYLRKKNSRFLVFLLKRKEKVKKGFFSSDALYPILFFATILSTIYAGYVLSLPLVEEGLMESPWRGAMSFSVGLLAVLGCHEMGHKLQAIKSGISSTWPYFIPMPFLPLGTLGAVIKIKSPIPTKDDAVKLGASGPIVGVLVAIPIVIIGMKMSYVVPATSFEEGGFYLGSSLLFSILSSVAISVPDGMSIWIHPLAFAGWVGLFVTMLNLLPAGQLDGGHVVRAVFGEKGHKTISSLTMQILIFLGILGILSEWGIVSLHQYAWSGWLIWGIIIYFLTKGGHPGPLNDIRPLSSSSKIIAFIVFVIFVMCFIPVPIVIG